MLLSQPYAAAAEWSFEATGGTAYHAPLTLAIYQGGFETHSVKPVWGTDPFEEAPYYSWRIGKWQDDKAWEFELIHDKMILEKCRRHNNTALGSLARVQLRARRQSLEI